MFVGDEIMNRRGLAWEGPGAGRGSYQLPYDPPDGHARDSAGDPGIHPESSTFPIPRAPKWWRATRSRSTALTTSGSEDDILYQAYYEADCA